MHRLNSVQGRIATLIAVAAFFMVIGYPLVGTAQNATPDAAQEELIQEGDQIFNNLCIACHQPEGAGIPGIYPMLNGNPLLTGDDPTYFVATLLTGRGGMPTFRGFSDDQIAGVTSYVRQAWDNDAAPVSPEEVAKVRADITEQQATTPTPEAQIQSGIYGGTPEAEATPGQ
ncbi:MAG TPA: cytochrome c [Thermomicrobiales bacterium]|nr:cytochrome c [Thermomicrobiales bacterium]